MCAFIFKTLVGILFIFFKKCQVYSLSSYPLLLIISFDGFRYNYFERNFTSNLLNLRPNGTYAEYMTSVFPSKTFPNHFSIATGVYVDVHGVLDNKVFDPILNKELNYSYELFHYNDDIVPIWTLNEKQGKGRHSGCMMWPGSNFEYQGILPKFYQVYNGSIPWKNRVDQLFSWFLCENNAINLGLMYFEEPDLELHSFGPDSPEVNAQLIRINAVVKYIMDKIVASELYGKINVVLLSDHGGQAVPYSHVIDLDLFLDNSTYSMYGVSPNLQIYPNPGKYEEVLSKLKSASKQSRHFTVYTKDEILDEWHYKDNGRSPPILLVANISYVFNDLYKHREKLKLVHHTNDLTNITIGTHGYDPTSKNMRAFFMSFGPLMKRNHTIPPFVNVDLYPLFAHILDLQLPTLVWPNGSLTVVQEMFVPQLYISNDYYIVAGVLISSLCVIVVISVAFVHFTRLKTRQQRKSSMSSYRILTSSDTSPHNFEGSQLLVTSEFEDD